MIVDLQNHAPAFLNLTKTMLEKSTIDANVSIRNFSKLFGADYDEMKAGDKVIVKAEFFDGTESQISFYRTQKRSDRRISIKGINHKAEAGHRIGLTFKHNSEGEMILIVNLTKGERLQPVREGNTVYGFMPHIFSIERR
jgi:hypothetical protein